MTLKERPTVTPIVTSPEPEVHTQHEPVPPEQSVDSDSVEYEGKVYSRESNALFWKVLDYLRSNPDARTLSVRKLADATGVSKSLVKSVMPRQNLTYLARFAKRETCAAHESIHSSPSDRALSKYIEKEQHQCTN